MRKALQEVVALARENSVIAIRVLTEIAENPDEPAMARVAAAIAERLKADRHAAQKVATDTHARACIEALRAGSDLPAQASATPRRSKLPAPARGAQRWLGLY